MAYDYIKSVSGDFPNGVCNASFLKYQIDNDQDITTVLNYVSVAGDSCAMNFVSEPSGAEKTEVDSLISAHTSTAISNYLRGCNCCCDHSMTEAERDAIIGTIASGAIIWNSTAEELQYWDGAAWQSIAVVEV